jgi:hypothetical protein
LQQTISTVLGGIANRELVNCTTLDQDGTNLFLSLHERAHGGMSKTFARRPCCNGPQHKASTWGQLNPLLHSRLTGRVDRTEFIGIAGGLHPTLVVEAEALAAECQLVDPTQLKDLLKVDVALRQTE